MKPEQFNQGLLRVVDTAIERLDMGIDPNCQQDLEHMIYGSTDRLMSEGARLTDGLLLDATYNLLLLVGAMAHDAKRNDSTVLHEYTLQHAKSFLCPLWPFC